MPTTQQVVRRRRKAAQAGDLWPRTGLTGGPRRSLGRIGLLSRDSGLGFLLGGGLLLAGKALTSPVRGGTIPRGCMVKVVPLTQRC